MYMAAKDEKFPIAVSKHHQSFRFGDFSPRSALSRFQRWRYHDIGTKHTAPEQNASHVQGSSYSRGVIDLNRGPDSPTLHPSVDFGRPENKIWKPGMEPTETEKKVIYDTIYRKYHDKLLAGVRTFTKPGILIAWDNSSSGHLGKNEAGTDVDMPAFILSNKGMENSAYPKNPESDRPEDLTTCSPVFLLEIQHQLQKALRAYNLPDEVALNLVYKGGYIPEHYNTFRHPELALDHELHSFQVEYNTRLTHDQTTFTAIPGRMSKLKEAFEMAMYNTYCNFLNQGYADSRVLKSEDGHA